MPRALSLNPLRSPWKTIAPCLVAVMLCLMVQGGAWAAPAAAPTSPVLPPGTPTPGQVQSTLPTVPSAPQPSTSAPQASTPQVNTTQVPEGGPTVVVQKFEITGNNVFGEGVLQEQVASWLNKPVTLADLYRAADAITKYYQSRGYGLARCTIPQQEFASGTATLEVVEGRIGKVVVEGETRTREAAIRNQATALKSGDVYTDAAMDRAVLLVNDLPGVQAQATLAPGTEFGTADLDYKVQEAPPLSGNLSVDDYGRRDVGLVRFNAEADAASPTGSGDRLSANLTHSEDDLLNFGGLTYSLPLGPAGGRLTADYNQSRYRVANFTPSALAISGSSTNSGLSYSYAELRGRRENLYLGAGIQHSGSATVANTVTVSDTNLTLAQFTAYYTEVHDDNGYYTLSGSFASNGHRDDGNHGAYERARLELDGSYVQPFATSWTFIGKGAGVWSPDPLSDTEKYSLGGPDNVRGFLSSEKRGDSGLFASGEVQRGFGGFSLGWFLDSGKVWDKRYDTLVTGTDATTHKPVTKDVVTPGEATTLTASGLELACQSTDRRWIARLQWAYAIGGYKPSDGNDGGHLWVSIGMYF